MHFVWFILNRIRKKANKHRLEVEIEIHVGDAVNSKNEVFYKMKTLAKKLNPR
jgi:hypothetical protein